MAEIDKTTVLISLNRCLRGSSVENTEKQYRGSKDLGDRIDLQGPSKTLKQQEPGVR